MNVSWLQLMIIGIHQSQVPQDIFLPKYSKESQRLRKSTLYESIRSTSSNFQRPRGDFTDKISNSWSKDMEMQLVSIERLCEYERPQPTESRLPSSTSSAHVGLELRNVIVRCGNVWEKQVRIGKFEVTVKLHQWYDIKMTWLMCMCVCVCRSGVDDCRCIQ